jgi:hypothetical protein
MRNMPRLESAACQPVTSAERNVPSTSRGRRARSARTTESSHSFELSTKLSPVGAPVPPLDLPPGDVPLCTIRLAK